jgi:transcription termination/antitermination protein NusG
MLEFENQCAPRETPAPGPSHWFAIQVATRREKHVAELLEYKGYAPFVPLRRIKEKTCGRRQSADSPLFPGYLFCQLQPETTGLVVTTPGVVRILGRGRTPMPLSENEVRNVRMIVDSRVPSESHRALHVGRQVTITEGPLRGLTGLMVKFKKTNRIAVSVSLLCRSILIELNSWHVNAVEGKHGERGIDSPLAVNLPGNGYMS